MGSLWVSSRPPPPRLSRASRPRLLRRHSRRNEMLSRGNPRMGIKLRNLNIFHCNPGARSFGGSQTYGGFQRLAFTSIERNFVGYLKHSLLVAPSLYRPLLFCIIRPIRVAEQYLSTSLAWYILLSNASHVCSCMLTGLLNKYLTTKKKKKKKKKKVLCVDT